MKLKKLSAFVLAAVILAALALGACDKKIPPPDGDVQVTVSFNLNYDGAPEPPAPKTVAVGAPYGTLPAPERENFDFAGWFFRDGIEQAAKTTVVTKTVNHTLYAKWLDGDGNELPWVPDPEIPVPDWDVDPELYPQYNIPVYKKGVKMKIGAWTPYIANNQSAFDDMAAAGMTFLIPEVDQLDFADNAAAAKAALDRADTAGLKVIINDSGLSGLAFGDWTIWNTSRVSMYKNHAAFMGLFIYDEPLASAGWATNFNWVDSQFGWVAPKSAKFYQEFGANTDKWFFMNLLPSGSGDSLYLGGSWYGTNGYAERFINKGLNCLSFDHYVLTKSSNAVNATPSVKSVYIECLEKAKKTAVKFNIPLNNEILSVPHYRSSEYYRDPTEAELRWQFVIDQTYGAEAITWYIYMTRYYSDSEWTYGEALVSPTGEKLPKYYYAQTINREAQKWAHVYTNYKWQKTVAVRQSSSSYNLFTNLDNNVVSGNNNISGVNGITGVTTDRHVLLGAFKDADNRDGYMLTNATDPALNYTAATTVKFGGAYKGILIYEKGVARVAELNAAGEAAISLAPGEGKFIMPLTVK